MAKKEILLVAIPTRKQPFSGTEQRKTLSKITLHVPHEQDGGQHLVGLQEMVDVGTGMFVVFAGVASAALEDRYKLVAVLVVPEVDASLSLAVTLVLTFGAGSVVVQRGHAVLGQLEWV